MANSMAVIPDNEIIVEGGGLVPSTQGASSGDVLTVGQDGPEWATPGGGGGGVPDVTNPLYIDTDDAVALRFGSGLRLEGISEDDTLAVALSGTGGLFYDDMDSNGLAVQLDPDGGLENVIDDGVQVGLKVKTDGTTIDINASGELEAIGGGGGSSVTTIVAPNPKSYTSNYDRVTFDFGSASPQITLNAGRNLWQITATMDGCSQFSGDTGFVFVMFSADFDDGVSTQTIYDQFTAGVTYNPTIGSSGTSAYVDIVMPIFVPSNMTNVVVTGVSFMFNNVSKVPQTPGGGSYIGIWSI